VLPLLMEQGANATSRQLAVAAGVSEGTIFNVFGDKEALLAAAFETAIDTAPFERAVSAINPAAPLEERLLQATKLIQRHIVDIWRLVTQLGPDHHHHRPGPFPDSPALTALLAADPSQLRVEPADGARLLRSITFACTHPMLTPKPRPAVAIVALFLHGASASPHAPPSPKEHS
jgi:AcrR family transcriptional regulator